MDITNILPGSSNDKENSDFVTTVSETARSTDCVNITVKSGTVHDCGDFFFFFHGSMTVVVLYTDG